MTQYIVLTDVPGAGSDHSSVSQHEDDVVECHSVASSRTALAQALVVPVPTLMGVSFHFGYMPVTLVTYRLHAGHMLVFLLYMAKETFLNY